MAEPEEKEEKNPEEAQRRLDFEAEQDRADYGENH